MVFFLFGVGMGEGGGVVGVSVKGWLWVSVMWQLEGRMNSAALL